MRVLLIDPPGPCKGLNAGLGYLAGALDAHCEEVLVLDLTNVSLEKDVYELGGWGGENVRLPISEIEMRIKSTAYNFKPQIIGISVKTFTANIASEIISMIKSTYPNIPIIVGGAHVTLDGANYLKETGSDIGVIGEGEITLLNVCNAIKDGRPLREIEGIIYKNGEEIIENPKRNIIRDLNNICFPNYDDFTSVTSVSSKILSYPILTSRGCPYACTYCSVGKISSKNWRSRSPQNVVQELIYAKEKYKIEDFIVIDDCFTFDIKRAKEICETIISTNLNLSWSCPNGIRADKIDEELLLKMRKSGCKEISIGVESADEYVFKRIRKGETLETVRNAIKMVKKAEIAVSGFFIIGLPYSSIESDLKSIEFTEKEGIRAFWGNLIPYPHTEVWDYVQTHGKMLRNYRESHHATNNPEPIFETPEYSENDRIKAFYTIILRTGGFGRLISPEKDGLIKSILKLLRYTLKYSPSSFPMLISFLVGGLRQIPRLIRTYLRRVI